MRPPAAAIAATLACLSLAGAQAPTPRRVSPQMQENRLVHHVRPEYPRLAQLARIQGTVVLEAFIDETGAVERLKLMGGHPFLVNAAFDAVKQWRYRPMFSGGMAVPVVTIISVTFHLDAKSGREDGTIRV